MTAEVAVLNKHGVALAADSAVTVNGPYGLKIYNTVNKLFTLSKFYPVGIMVYSSAEVMGYPVETVIKHFREKHLGDGELGTIEEYAQRLQQFLETDDVIFSNSDRRNQVLRVADKILKGASQELNSRVRTVLEDQTVSASLDHVIESSRQELLSELESLVQNWKDLHGVDQTFRSWLLSDLKGDLLDIIRANLFDNEVQLSTSAEDQALHLTINLLLMEPSASAVNIGWFHTGETGFVVAGFGEEEFLPRLHFFEFVYSYHGVTRKFIGHRVSIGDGENDMAASIVPFAQTEMIRSFIDGRSYAFDELVASSVTRYFEQTLTNVRERPGGDIVVPLIESLKQGLLDTLSDDLARWTYETQLKPTLRTVAALPKAELAVLAEALVNLTIHKRRASPDAETVGPPTDVAVISKGDGFIWIKRKHYFEPELNPHFSRNYFRNAS